MFVAVAIFASATTSVAAWNFWALLTSLHPRIWFLLPMGVVDHVYPLMRFCGLNADLGTLLFCWRFPIHLYFQPLPKTEHFPCRRVFRDGAVETWGRDPEADLGLQDLLCECSFHMGIGMPRNRLASALCMGGWVMAPWTKLRGREHEQCLGQGWWLTLRLEVAETK